MLVLRFRPHCHQCVAKSYTTTRCKTLAMFEFTMLSQQTDVHKIGAIKHNSQPRRSFRACHVGSVLTVSPVTTCRKYRLILLYTSPPRRSRSTQQSTKPTQSISTRVIPTFVLIMPIFTPHTATPTPDHSPETHTSTLATRWTHVAEGKGELQLPDAGTRGSEVRR